MTSNSNLVKRLIWLYFWMLLLEGAFRKWFLPGLAAPLLLARDPVVIAIYLMAAVQGRFPRSGFLVWIGGLTIASLAVSLVGDGNLKVSVFGLHANFLHLPLIFVIAEYFDLEDVKKIGKWLLVMLVPMTLIAVMQFRGGPDARINVGAGGELGAQLYAASGRVRASGTFSFVTGFVSFLAICSSFLLYHFLQKRVYAKLLAAVALPALILSLGVSGSRSAILAVSIVMACAGFACIRRWDKFGGTAFVRALGICLVFLVLNQTRMFREGVEVERARFETGGGVKTGIVERYFGEFVSAFHTAANAPLLGVGLGMGTTAGAAIITKERQFLLGEGEWSRVLMELGPLMGTIYLLLRISLIATAFSAAYRALNRGHILPILLLGMSGLEMLTGQFGQSTALGFGVFSMGLTFASTRIPVPLPVTEGPQAPDLPQENQSGSRRRPGRSRYAEALHSPSSNTPQ